jgi:F-type H+-transporting ATPase subunit epsilon
VAISWGYAQVTPNGVNVLAETAERPEDIDIGRADLALKSAEERISTESLDPEMLRKLSAKIARARVRKEVGGEA